MQSPLQDEVSLHPVKIEEALKIIDPPEDLHEYYRKRVDSVIEIMFLQRNEYEALRLSQQKKPRATVTSFRKHLSAARGMMTGADPSPGVEDSRLPELFRNRLMLRSLVGELEHAIAICDLFLNQQRATKPVPDKSLKRLAAALARGLLRTETNVQLSAGEKGKWCRLAAILYDPAAETKDMRNACREMRKRPDGEWR